MRLCLLVTGPVPEALREHVSALGSDVEVTTVAGPAAPAGAVDGPGFDIAIAGDWRACADVFRVPAARHALYLRDLEHRRMAPGDPEAIVAAIVHDLPLDLIVEAQWLADELSSLRPEARVRLVRPGVAAPVEPVAAPGPLRVLIAGDDGERASAEAALAAMSEPHASAEAPSEADVVVLLSNRDGMLGAPLAGFAAGATALVTPAPGHDELVLHRVNGLVTDPDDDRGAGRWLDTLARDRELLAGLRAEAHRTALAWPSREAAAAEFASVLEELAGTEPPADLRWPTRLVGDALAQATVVRGYVAEQETAAREGWAAADRSAEVVRSAGVPLDGQAIGLARRAHRLGQSSLLRRLRGLLRRG